MRAGRPAAMADYSAGVDIVDMSGFEPVVRVRVKHRGVVGHVSGRTFETEGADAAELR